MPSSSTERHEHHDHADHIPTAGPTASPSAVPATRGAHTHHRGQHVMPDGTVMDGAHHDHYPHAPAAPRPAPTGDRSQVAYTCPMHPQVRQIGPGHCPICGMALEPVLATAGTGESPELRDMMKRFRIGTALTVPVFALETTPKRSNAWRRSIRWCSTRPAR